MAVELAQIPAERTFRGPGCSTDCRVIRALVPTVFGRTELMLHDPSSHEAYGMSQGAEFGAGFHDVETGPLLVRLAAGEAFVDGKLILLTPKEWELLSLLARRLDKVVLNTDTLALIWPWYEQQTAPHPRHILRVTLSRVRAKLGPAAYLLETRVGRGLLLRREATL